MTDTEIHAPAKPAKPKKRRKPPRRAAAVPAKPAVARVPAELAGMTPNACPSGCKLEHCVITCMPICAHPMKGGLQAALAHKPDVVERFNKAKTAMAHHMLDLTGAG